MVDEKGAIAGRGYREITQHYPEPGHVEHDALEIFERTIAAAREAVAQSRAAPDAIGITNQRETVVLWDRSTGKPVAPAIVWQDRRTSMRCAELAPAAKRIAALTGLVVDPYFSATKLEWLLGNDSIRSRAERGELLFGTIDAWLVWKLTGGAVHATDPTNASRTMLYDIDRREWSEELLTLFHIPRSVLPEVRASAGDFGHTSAEFFGEPIPIRGVAGDQQAALYGQACWTAGSSKCTYGTGAFLLLNTGASRPAEAKQRDGLLTTLACDSRGEVTYALEASIFIAGAAIQWLRDGLRIISSASDTESMARSVDSNGGVYFVPALVGLGAPHWEPKARGTVVGLTRGTTSAHLVRAALESMAYGVRDVLDVMFARFAEREKGNSPQVLRVDGGATANNWLMQFQADLLNTMVERPHLVESTALGAAGLAGVASGIWPDPGNFRDALHFKRFEPRPGNDVRGEAEVHYLEWKRAVRTALHWAAETS